MKKKVKNTVLRLVRGDITDMEVEAFVFYASPDLKLGTGFGSAIAVRGGPSIQKKLDEIGGAETCESVLTEAGELKAKHIIHSVGPRHNEEETERKLRDTVTSALKVAEEQGIAQLAFPPMGSGFYGVLPAVSSRIMMETFKEHFEEKSGLEEVLIVVQDNRDFQPFEASLAAIA